jgi:hypothetical protein
MECRDVYLKYTYPATRRSTVQYHRVWNLDLFLKARVEEGRSASKLEDRFEVTMVTKP